MWWVRPLLALKARYRHYDTLLQGLKPRILQAFYQDGSVADPRNFASVLVLQFISTNVRKIKDLATCIHFVMQVDSSQPKLVDYFIDGLIDWTLINASLCNCVSPWKSYKLKIVPVSLADPYRGPADPLPDGLDPWYISRRRPGYF